MQPPQMLSLIERLVDAVERMSSELTCLNKTVSSLVVQNHTVGRVAPSSQTRNKKDGFTETETLDLLVMDTAEDPPRGSFTSMPLLTGQFVEEADVLQDSAPVDNVPATSKLRATETNTQNEAERGEWQEHLATASDAEEIQAGTGMVNPLVPVKKENDGIITVEDWQYENSVEEVAGISQGDQTRNIIAREEVTAFNEEQRANSTHAPVLPAMTMHPDPACHNTGSRNQLRGICFTGDATNQMIAEDTNEVYQESDGTIIDDDNFASHCEDEKEQKEHLAVVIWPRREAWVDPHDQVISNVPPEVLDGDQGPSLDTFLEFTMGETTTNHSPLYETGTSRKPGFPISNVSVYLDPLLEHLRAATLPKNYAVLRKSAIKHCYSVIGNHMLHKLKDYRKETAGNLAQYVMSFENGKYEKIFQIKVGDCVADSGFQSFRQQIYAYVNANKGEHNKKKRPKRRRREENTEEPVDDFDCPLIKQNCYGCVALEVPFPEGENEVSQEEKRASLTSTDPSSEEALKLMAATYASQRLAINSTQPLTTMLPALLKSWPLLFYRSLFLQHADTLMGKDVAGVWNKNVNEKACDIIDFMSMTWRNELKKERPSAISKDMVEILEEADNIQESRRKVGKCIAMFPLIAGYMQDKLHLLYQVISATASDDDVLEAAQHCHAYPVLIVRGSSIFDEHSQFDIVLFGSVTIKAGSAVEGFLLLLLSYFIFSCLYPPQLHSTLEFFQRFFLRVNPPPEQGNKRAKQKRTVDSVDSKVKGLSEALTSFRTQCTATD